jgi:hypothetical protein
MSVPVDKENGVQTYNTKLRTMIYAYYSFFGVISIQRHTPREMDTGD